MKPCLFGGLLHGHSHLVSDGMVTAPCDFSGRGCDRFSGETARGRHKDVCCEDETRLQREQGMLRWRSLER